MLRRLPLLLIPLVLGCATTRTAEPAPDAETVELDPMVLKAEGGKVRALQARPLFESASKAYAAGRFEKALAAFRDVAESFPDTKYAPHALFNAGLAAMQLARWEEGLDLQQRARQALSGGDEWDAAVQITICLEKLERWAPLVALVQEVLKEARLGVVERIEAQARLGIARYELGRLALAERSFKRVIAAHRKHAGVPGLDKSEYVARAQFLVGEIYRGLFASIRFRLPVETMRRDLTDKSSFFLKGQSAYLRCVRLNNPYWSVAAGYRLGKLYEDFYYDMMAAEVPPELDEDDRKVYYEELKSHIKPLVVRAVEIYERNLGMSDRLGLDGEWTRKTQASLDRMRDILRREFQ